MKKLLLKCLFIGIFIINAGHALAVTVSAATNTSGLTSASSALYPQSAVVLYGITVNVSGGSTIVNSIVINSSNGTALTSLFSNVKLYHSSSATYDGSATPVSGVTLSLAANSITFTTIAETLTTNKYYYLVLDYTYSGTATNYFQPTGLTVTCSTGTYSPSGYENYYNLSPTSVNVSNNTGGLTSNSNSLTPGTLAIAMFSFSVTVQGNATFSAFNISSTVSANSANNYLSNLKFYVSASSTYSSSATQIAGSGTTGTIAFNGNFVDISGISQNISGATSQVLYFYLVADYTVYTGINPGTIQFNFTSGQTQNEIVQSGPASNTYNTFTATGNTYTFANNITVSSLTAAANGVTQTPLNYGDKAVVFAFSVKVIGTLTANTFNIYASPQANTYFSTGTLYSSNDPYFVDATATVGTINTTAFTTGISVTGLSEAINNTTKYYFLVLNYDNINVTSDGTQQLSFTTTQAASAIVQTTPSASYNSFSATGAVINMGVTYDWTGRYTNDLMFAPNYINLNNGVLNSSPGPYDQIRIGVVSYLSYGLQLQPTAYAAYSPMSFAKVIFGNNNSPILTVQSGNILTLTTGLTINSGATTPTLAGTGELDIGPLSTLSFGSTTSGNLTIQSGFAFKLKSNATGTATVGQLGSTSVTGAGASAIIAERYIAGGTGTRGYRLLSSPTASQLSTPISGINSYDITQLHTKSYVTGPGTGHTLGTLNTNNFDASANNNPSVFVYKESDADPTSQAISASDYKGFATASEYLPVGNGLLYFFRGDKTLNQAGATAGSALAPPYPVPNPVTLEFKGTINQGSISVKAPVFTLTASYYHLNSTANPVTAQTVANSAAGFITTLSYTKTGSGGTVALPNDGFHLIGNPYPSTIDLEALPTIFGTGIGSTIYILTSAQTFGTYQRTGTGATSTTFTGGGSRYVLSGQGFFVKALSTAGPGTPATVTFLETAKMTGALAASGTVTGTPLAFSVKVPVKNLALKNPNPEIKIKLIQDSVFYNETIVSFNPANSNNYDEVDNDAPYLTAPSQQIFLYSYTADGTPCAINRMGSMEGAKPIKLFAAGGVTGTYQMQFSGTNSIDRRYRVYLKDAFMKDSLDITANSTYAFNIDLNNSATYVAGRFTIVIHSDSVAPYKLLTFTGTKQTKPAAVTLAWTTQNESDVVTFGLERSIDGGKTFTTLDSLQSNSQGFYNFLDGSPFKGKNIYRLAQNDVNNVVTYSADVTISFADTTITAVSSALTLYPNPATSTLNLSVNTKPAPNSLSISIMNSAGVIVGKYSSTQTTGWQTNVSSLIPGIYIIKVVDGSTQALIGESKFIKL